MVLHEYRWPLCSAVILHILLLLLLLINFQTRSKVATEENNTIQATLISSAQLQALVSQLQAQPQEAKEVQQKKLAQQQALKEQQQKEAQLKQQMLEKQKAAEQKALQQIAMQKAAQQKQQQKAVQQKLKQQSLEQSLMQEEMQADKPKPQSDIAKSTSSKSNKQLEQMMQNQLAMESQSLQAKASAALSKAQQGEIDKYKALILQRIQQNWIVPGKVDNLSCVLSIDVAPGGMIMQVKLIKSSGNDALDRSAIAAVNKASPLPVPRDAIVFGAFRQFTLTVAPSGDAAA